MYPPTGNADEAKRGGRGGNGERTAHSIAQAATSRDETACSRKRWWKYVHRRTTELFQRSTVHGLSHASVAQTRWGKAFWVTLLLAGSFGFGVNLVRVVERYYEQPLLTSYFSDHEEFIWPDITLCNHVPVRLAAYPLLRREWEELLRKASRFDQTDMPFFKKFQMPRTETNELINITLALSTLNTEKFLFNKMDTFIRIVASQAKKVVIQHSIEIGGEWEDMYSASPSFSMMHFMRHRTPCYTFRMSLLDNRERERSISGLAFGIDMDYQTYLIFNSNFLHSGAQLYVTVPRQLPPAKGILVLPGHTTSLNIRMQRTKYYKGKRDCRDEQQMVNIYDPTLSHSAAYEMTTDDCIRILSQKLYHSKCDCFLPFLPIPKLDDHKPRVCFNMSHFNRSQLRRNARCLNNVVTRYENEAVFKELVRSECHHLEKVPCNKLHYEISSISEMWPELWTKEISDNRRKFMESLKALTQNDSARNTNDTLGRIRRNFANIMIMRANEKGDLVQEDLAYPLSNLISDVGGLMGLWMGLSVVGLFELIELSMVFVKAFFRYNRGVNDTKSQQDRDLLTGGL